MANKLLGIHLTSDAVKLAEVEQQQVVNWSIDYLPSEKTAEAAVKALSAALKNKKILTRQVMVALSGTEVCYKLVEMPGIPEKEIDSALRFKLESVFPFPVSTAVIDYYRIGDPKTAEKPMFFVAAVPKNYINGVIKTLKKAGLSVKDIVTSSSALFSAEGLKEPAPYALVCVGKTGTSIVLVKQGQVVFAREVGVGGENIARAMVGEVQTEAGKLEFDYAKAEEIKNNFGVPLNPEEYSKESNLPAAEIMAMMRPALEKIGDEIQRTFVYYHETSGDQIEFSKAYFTGEETKTKNFIAYFSAVLGIAILPLPLSTTGAEQDAHRLSLAIGAATIKKPYLSLLPEELKRDYIKLLKKYVFVWAFIGFLLVLLIVYGSYFMQYRKLSAEHKLIEAKLRQQEGTFAKETQTAAIFSFFKDWNTKGNTDRFVKAIGAAHRLASQNIFFVKIAYNRSTSQFIIQGVTYKEGGKADISDFIENMKANPGFSAIDLAYVEESNDFTVPTYDFEIKCVLLGKP
ncbi:MAG: pilus assembly protein PilM [Candidatus Margulisiibacteriota bacterium]